MLYGYCAPISLSCARFIVKHTCSCSSLLPSRRNRTRGGSSTIALHLQQWNSISVPTSGIHLPFSSESNRNSKYSSLKVASSRPGEMVVTGNTWDELVKNNEMPVLVEFWAPWCGPCRMVHREIEEIAKEYAGRISCFTLNADDDMEVAEKYEVKVVPVVLLFRNGEKQDSITGTMPYHVYVSSIEKLLSS